MSWRTTFALIALLLGRGVLDAQPQSMRVSGWGGMGYEQSTFGAPGLATRTSNLMNELGVNGNGYFYDPRLLIFDLNTNWNRNQNYLEQFTGSGNTLTYNGSFTFLSQRNFPFSLFFSRSNSDADYGFNSAFNTIARQFGVRGAVKKSRLGAINFEAGTARDESSFGGVTQFVGKQRYAGLGLTRDLGNWQLRLTDNYTTRDSAFSTFRQTNNLLHADVSRAWGDRFRLGIIGDHSQFNFRDASGGLNTNDSLDLVAANAAWKTTDKLDTYYTADLSRNAINPFAVASRGAGSIAPPLPLNLLSTRSISFSSGAGGNYRLRENLTLSFNSGYSRNGLPKENLANLSPAARESVTTGSLNAGGGIMYRKEFRRLQFHTSETASWQRFNTVAGGAHDGVGFGTDNAVSTGDPRIVRLTVSHRYSERKNPIFFNLAKSRDQHASAVAQSRRFRFDLQGSAEYSHNTAELVGSNLTADVLVVSGSAGFRKLSVYGSHSMANSDQFFVLSALLNRPGIPAGIAPVPAGVLLRPVATDLGGDRFGFTWRPRWNLDFAGRFTRDRQLIFRETLTDVLFWRVEVIAQYKFGRFTIMGGYGKGVSDTSSDIVRAVENRYNRWFFRIRFPFHVFG